MNQPKAPVDPGFADLDHLPDEPPIGLPEVVRQYAMNHPDMEGADFMDEASLQGHAERARAFLKEQAPDAFEDSAYDVYSGKIKEPLADETDRLARQMDYMDWVRNGGVGTQGEYEYMKAAQAPAPRFRPTNYDAAVANGYEGTFSDWLRENVENGYDLTFQPDEPKVPVWHKVAAVIMVLAIAAVVVAVFTQWRDGGAPPVATKSIIVGGQA